MENPQQATAYHEAGHAVMALLLGRPVANVSILARHDFLGTCEFGKAVFRPTEDWLEREMLIAVAGLAAEARFTGEYRWDGASRDYAYAGRLAEQRAGDERKAERLLRRVLAKAENLLNRDETWAIVERLATELLRVNELSGRAVRHLFEECQREER